MKKSKTTDRKTWATRGVSLLGIGRVYPKDSMFLRNHVGEAAAGKRKYEMATNMNGTPIIKSKQTGKWFSLSWQDIITLAEKAGIEA